MSLEKSNYQKRADVHKESWREEMSEAKNRNSRELGIFNRAEVERKIRALAEETANRKELEFIHELKKISPEAGIFLVGGAVRDAVLGKKSKDIDLVVNRIDPVDVVDTLSRYGRVTFDKNPNINLAAITRADKERLIKETYGIIKFLPRDSEFEELIDIGYPRFDDYSEAGKSGVRGIKKDAVPVTDPNLSIAEDLGRRDLTINAIAVNILNGEIADEHDGIEDIIGGRIRAVGDPEERILKEDLSRGFRAIRFACAFKARLDPEIKRVIREIFQPAESGTSEIYAGEADKLAKIKTLEEQVRSEFGLPAGNLPRCLQIFWDSAQNKPRLAVAREVMGMEITKAIQADPVKFVELMDEIGALSVVLPELARLKSVAQSREHHREGDAFRHTVMVLENLPESAPLRLKLAAICHDLGKFGTQKKNKDGSISFYGHNKQSAILTEGIFERFRLPKNIKEETVWLVDNHMEPILDNVKKMENRTIEKKFLKRGRPVDDLIALARADSLGSIPETGAPDTENVDRFAARIKELRGRLRDKNEQNIPLPVTGDDLLAMGYKKGPVIGRILEAVKEERLRGEDIPEDISREYIDKVMAKNNSKDGFVRL